MRTREETHMKTLLKTILFAVVTLLITEQSAQAASTKDEVLELQAEVQLLKDGQKAMQKDLAEIKKLLQQGAKAAPTPSAAKPFEPRDVSIAGAPVMGDVNAKVTLIEYSDYQCPFCSRHSTQTMPEIIKNYVESGKLKFVMREFPIPNLHARATAASQAALCAGDQGKYWEMHDVLFANQRKMSDEDLLGYGASIGLDSAQFSNCIEQGTHSDQVKKDIEQGQELGVSGTPSFVLGLTDPDDPDMVKVSRFVRGARSYADFAREIDDLLDILAH